MRSKPWDAGAPTKGKPVIAVCGEALIDLVPDDETASRFNAIPGGGPANAAVACARLGIPTALFARISSDAFGRRIRAHLERNGVDLRHAVTADEPSSLAIVSLDDGGAASYRFDLVGTADWQWSDGEFPAALPAEIAAVHAGSLALALAPGAAAVEAFLKRARMTATVCIDPNVRPQIAGDFDYVAGLTRWCSIADIVKASAEDLEFLHPGRDAESAAMECVSYGVTLCVVTLGADGLVAATRDGLVHLPAPPTTVVDTVGAGDTFTAGLLASLHRAGVLGGRLDALSPEILDAALRYGLRAAAFTCARPGADPPREADLQGSEN